MSRTDDETSLSWFRHLHLLPPGTTRDGRLLVAARAVRAFGDGLVSVLLPLHLVLLGFDTVQIGVLTTATLVGSATLTLALGLLGHRLGRRWLLMRAALLMVATGLGFAVVHDFWPLLVVAFVGTLNPSTGDVSLFLPAEQAILPQTVSAEERTALFARYGLLATLVAAFGSLAAGVPTVVAARTPLSLTQALDAMFLLYALLGLVLLVVYTRLSPAIELPPATQPTAPLGPSRRMVYTLAAVFSLDSFGSGFVVQALLALWLFQRFGLSAATTGAIFFWVGLGAASSQLLAPWLARRIGLINTMVFTHLPANLCLLLTPFMPSLPLAIALLLVRSLCQQMDAPARSSFVMAVVTPAERPAAASLTNVPRSLAASLSPLLAGYLLSLSPFGWPLVIGGALKASYDLLLLALFRKVRPPEETTRAHQRQGRH